MSHLGDRLSALVDGELGGAERDRAHAHLAACEPCRAEAAELRALKRKLRGLMDGAPSEAAMTSRLIAMTGPGGPMPPRRRLLRVVPGRRPVSGPVASGPGSRLKSSTAWPSPRRRRYLVLGTVSLVVGLGTAAFTAGGGGDAAPGPRITPSVEMYSVEHAITTGEVPFPAPAAESSSAVPSSVGPSSAARPWLVRRREVRVFTPVIRSARNGRSPLVLAAALAVAVPGLLVSACSSQSSAGAAGSDAVSAAGRAAAAGKAPVAVRRPATVKAVRLLTQAAQAAIVTSYQGQEILTRWSQGGGNVLVSSIWHISGGQTVTQTTADGASFSSQSYLSSDTDGQSPEGVLGVTAPLVQLLESHYVVAYAGTGSADNRTAQVVEAWRADGSIAARFWLDDATKLPLEREIFDTAAHVIGQDVFIDVSFATPGTSPRQSAAASAAARVSASPQGPWTDPFSRHQLLALRSRGWVVPAELPGGLSLFTGAETQADTGAVLDLGYSDGLSMVSVFEQRGKLPATLAGWRKIKTSGHVVFALPDQRALTWGGHGIVFTMVADAPPQTVDAVVGALPHDGPTGFWKRMSRGLVRVASWVNPFH